MKNANQIRPLLKRMLAFSNVRPRTGIDAVFAGLTREALALLPCETCNGTKQVSTPQSVGFGHENEIMDTCPDCQPKKIPNINPAETISEYLESMEKPADPCYNCSPCKRCGGTNGVHKQVDDPQAGNSHMLTKMQCPLDPKNPTFY